MKIIKTASGKKTIKMSKSEWESIGKKAGWIKEARVGGIIETTVYLDSDGRYKPYSDSDDDEGVGVIIKYNHYKASPRTYHDMGEPAYNEIISMERVDDGTQISNYIDDDFAELMYEDREGALEDYWETKGDLMRDERDLRGE